MPAKHKPVPKALDGLMKSKASKYYMADAHAEFAERSQILRWFGERSNKELKALRTAFEKSTTQQTK